MKQQDRWFNLNSPYAYRDDNLRRMGFRSYREYLRSQLWQALRAQALLNPDGTTKKCFRCWKTATQVHHRAYDPATLAGKNLWALVPVCAEHHKRGEQPKRRQKAHDRLVGANKRIWCNGQEGDHEHPQIKKERQELRDETLKWRKLVEKDVWVR